MLALQEWKDEKLKWNQTNYGNLTKYKNRICIFQRLCLINLKFKKHKNSKFTVLSWCFFYFRVLKFGIAYFYSDKFYFFKSKTAIFFQDWFGATWNMAARYFAVQQYQSQSWLLWCNKFFGGTKWECALGAASNF